MNSILSRKSIPSKSIIIAVIDSISANHNRKSTNYNNYLMSLHYKISQFSVAISVGNIKETFADGFTDGSCVPKKKVSRLKYTDRFIPSVIVWLTDGTHTVGKVVGECLKYRSKISVCTFVGHYGRYCQILTD
jgi:hypothetical protein